MNIFSLSSLLTGIISLVLGSFVYLKNPKRGVNITWFLMCLSAGIWSLGVGIAFLLYDKNAVIFWHRIHDMSAIFIPVFFVHFVHNLLELRDKRRNILKFLYSFAIILASFGFSKYFIKDVVPKLVFRFYPVPGPLYVVFFIFFIICVIYGEFLIISNFKSLSKSKKLQVKYVCIGLTIGFAGGITNFFPIFNLPVYPFGNYLIILYTFFVSYAIVRHHLMEIEVIIKKSPVFAGMFSFVFGVVVTVAMLVSQVFGGGGIVSLAISALIITFTLRPIESWLINTTDKYLFQKKYEYKQILKTFIDEVITVLNLDEVINSTLELLDKTVHPYTSCIFILNKVEDKYQLYNSFGLENKSIAFSSDSKLITLLKKSHNPAVIKQVDGIIGVSPEIIPEMNSLKAVLVLPLMLHDDLIGFISLGRKKSEEEYAKEDLDILLDLARTESIAVGNAQLLAEAAQSERRAAIGTMAAGIYHEIGNPLNIINTKIQVFLVGIERGFYKNESREEIIQECKTIVNETLRQTNRIADITRRLSNFAKPSREFKPQLISVSQEIDETLSVVGHDLELERITIEKQIPSDLPKILADRREIQQIFFNLIRNAAQAIEQTGTITIKADSARDSKVHIEIEDTGKGISEDKRHRIFEPFFTTKGPKRGTGLGLSIVRQLVWRNKGEISFRSQVGVGTIFILEFPKGV